MTDRFTRRLAAFALTRIGPALREHAAWLIERDYEATTYGGLAGLGRVESARTSLSAWQSLAFTADPAIGRPGLEQDGIVYHRVRESREPAGAAGPATVWHTRCIRLSGRARHEGQVRTA